MAGACLWQWARSWAAAPASTQWHGLGATSTTGISSHQKPATMRGTISPFWESTVALKIGTARPTLTIAEPVALCLFNQLPIPTRLLPGWWKRRAALEFRHFPAITDG